MGDGDPTPRKQGLVAPWQPGRSGNPAGRPKGSRSKLSEGFFDALHADFLEHGAETIERMRESDPVAYVRTIASLLPRHFKVDDADDPYANMTDEEIMERIRQRIAELDLQLTVADDYRETDRLYRGSPDKNEEDE